MGLAKGKVGNSQKRLAGQKSGRGWLGNKELKVGETTISVEGDGQRLIQLKGSMLWGHWFAGAPSKTLGGAE